MTEEIFVVVKNIRMDKKDVLLCVETGMREVTFENICVYIIDEPSDPAKRFVPSNL